jgi:hypothetical protein
MQSGVTARTALLSGLIDYAGLFPPESRTMERAVEGFRDARALQSWMMDRFIVPERLLEELAPFLDGEPEPWPLAVVMDTPFGDWSRGFADNARSFEVVALAMRDTARFEIAEIRIPTEHVTDPALGAMLASIRVSLDPIFDTVLFEVALGDDWEADLPRQLQAISEAAAGAKIRCGGAAAEHFPTPSQVGTFISTCAELGLAFKATAGLHHPLRHWDGHPGVMRHGFLNITGAAVLAHALGLGKDELSEIVAEEDPAAFELAEGSFRWRHRAATASEIERARTRLMLGYGSCNFTEPVADLVELGWL